MDIKDVEVGMKVKLVSTLSTETYLGYSADMLSVGECSEVVYVDDDRSVKLSDNCWYCVSDLKPYTESRQNNKIGNLTVSISSEDKEEIAKNILKVVLQELYVGIENISKDLDEGEVGGDVTPKESLMTEQYVLDKLLDQINIAINMSDYDSAVKLSESYQCIKSVSSSNARKI